MADLAAIEVQVRAHLAAWRGQGRSLRGRLARSRHILVSALLVVAGLAGLLGFASLLGGWCVGLVGMAESAGALWVGLNRDDGRPLPRRGGRTVGDVLEDARRLPQ